MSNLENLIENNWDELKEYVKSKWSKLTSQDINQIEGSYDILIGKLKKTYGGTKKEIEKELNEFFSSDSFEEIKNTLQDKKDTALNEAASLKESVEKYAQNYLSNIKNKSIELEENIMSYAKENPLKTIGTAAIICFAITKMWSSHK